MLLTYINLLLPYWHRALLAQSSIGTELYWHRAALFHIIVVEDGQKQSRLFSRLKVVVYFQFYKIYQQT